MGPLANDAAGLEDVPLDPATPMLLDANGALATAAYVPTVTAAVAVMVDTIVVEAERGQTVSINPSAGVDGLNPGTVRIIDATGAQVTTWAVAGEGVWNVDSAGLVTFTPTPDLMVTPHPSAGQAPPPTACWWRFPLKSAT